MTSKTTEFESPLAGHDRSDTDRVQCSPIERVLGWFTIVRPGEGRSVVLFGAYAFALLVCYYVLKTIREPLLLASGSAALKSYAYAAVAAVLLVSVPLYGVLFKRAERCQLIRWITAFFAANLAVFYVLGRSGLDIGFAYYVWVGVFGVAMLAQFWAHAAHAYDLQSGQRVFPVIMAGAAAGGLVGPRLSSALFPLLGPWNLLLVAILLLALTLPLAERTAAAVPRSSRHVEDERRAAASATSSSPFGGFSLVLGNRYLLLLAGLAVLLNCVNTTGEYILTELVIRDADRQIAAGTVLDKGTFIAEFYGNYYFAVNALSMLFQMFLVARIFRWIGVQGATLILPIVALVGYGLVVFVPVFGLIRAVKVLENSTDYSIMNTARHALYLPLPTRHQYEGKTAVDTFFWRLGDLVQAGVIYAGLHWFGFDFRHFALLNMILGVVWLVIALQIGKRYPRRQPAAPRRTIHWRPAAVGTAATVVALATFAAPTDVNAGPAVASATLEAGAAAAPAAANLFADERPLSVELVFDSKALCRRTTRSECEDAPATLVVGAAQGTPQRVNVRLRVRGIWRNEAGNCAVPPLFVLFPDGAPGTPFAGQTLLPLTTHCRDVSEYEQYVLKEYLAYRIYNLLTDSSLRVRLARITYRDTGHRRERVSERYAFFTEHFKSLAAREHATLRGEGDFDLADGDAHALATVELFQYLIGNTDWSVTKGHNMTYLVGADGVVTPVPFDFDFSGLVNASYAGPPPGLPIRSVTERLFRGFCRPGFEWSGVFDEFRGRQRDVASMVEQIPGLDDGERAKAQAYLETFFDAIAGGSGDEIVQRCRRPPQPSVAQTEGD